MMNYIYNYSKNTTLLEKAIIADSFIKRLKGLLGKTGLDHGEGLVINPCNSIHTIGMKFPIDVAFVDEDNIVIHLIIGMPKGKLSPIIKDSKYVIEAVEGEFEARGLELGDEVKVVR